MKKKEPGFSCFENGFFEAFPHSARRLRRPEEWGSDLNL